MAILHTHRQHLIYLERARLRVDNERLVYEQSQKDSEYIKMYNIPSLNTTAILLGQGSSMTQCAARKCADDGVMIAFTGSYGTPLLMASQTFRPNEYMQKWVSKWFDENWRLETSKYMQELRCEILLEEYKKHFTLDEKIVNNFLIGVKKAETIQELMGYEGIFVRQLYSECSKFYGQKFKREKEGTDKSNRFVNHAGYLVYGLSSTVLWCIGISPAFGVTHGATRSGGLVFDLADIIKSAMLPVCFNEAKNDVRDNVFREIYIDKLFEMEYKNGAIGYMFDCMKTITDKIL